MNSLELFRGLQLARGLVLDRGEATCELALCFRSEVVEVVVLDDRFVRVQLFGCIDDHELRFVRTLDALEPPASLYDLLVCFDDRRNGEHLVGCLPVTAGSFVLAVQCTQHRTAKDGLVTVVIRADEVLAVESDEDFRLSELRVIVDISEDRRHSDGQEQSYEEQYETDDDTGVVLVRIVTVPIVRVIGRRR